MPSVSPTAQAESLDTLLGIADSDSDPLQNLDTIISQATLGPTFSPTALQQLASDAPTALLQALASLAPTVLFSGGGAGLGLADSPADAPGRGERGGRSDARPREQAPLVQTDTSSVG